MSANTNSQNVCVISNVDSFLGYALAYRFLEAKKKKEDDFISDKRIRVLCRNQQGYGLNHLKEMGAEIIEIDYQNEKEVRNVLKDALTVALIPEYSQKRLKEAECLIKASREEKIKFLCMHSVVGVDRIESVQEFHNLHEYAKIEKLVQENFEQNHTIIRHTKFSQLFYFMAPQIEGDNKVALPVKEDAKWGCVDANDTINAVYMLARKEHESHNNNSTQRLKKLYQLTPEHVLTTKEIVREIGKGLQREGLKFVEISEHDLKEYLQRMKDNKRFKERPERREEGQKWDRDGPFTFPLGKYLNEYAVGSMLECWRLANKGKMDIKTDDLEQLLNRKPRTMEEYFKKNRDNFRQFK